MFFRRFPARRGGIGNTAYGTRHISSTLNSVADYNNLFKQMSVGGQNIFFGNSPTAIFTYLLEYPV